MEHSEQIDDRLIERNESKKNEDMVFHKVLQRYIPIVVVFLSIIFVLSYFISPWSKVGTVSVEGNGAIYDQTIIDQSRIRGGDSMIDVARNHENYGRQVTEQLPQIKDTTIQINGMNDIVIQVEEYETVAYIAKEGSYLRVLENGTVLDDVYNISLGNQPVLSNFEEGKALNLMIEELSKLEAPILNLISEIELVDDRTNPLFIQVFMNNGNRVLSSIPEFSEKIPYYPQMVQAVSGQKGVFDMEVGVYFIPFVDGQENEADAELDEESRQPVEGFNG